MTWLSEWLKEIIFVVLISVFIELLLPNRSMERYVKFVVSLLILLTILSPVIRLFSSDAEQKLETALVDNINGIDDKSVHASTALILQQGEELKKKREAESLQWAGEEAARQMKEQIQRETGLPVERVTVKLQTKTSDEGKPKRDFNSKQTELSISAIEVYMGQAMTEQVLQSSDKDSKNDSQIKIHPVEEVRIDVNIQHDSTAPNQEVEQGNQTVMANTEDAPSAKEGSQDLIKPPQEGINEQIKQLLSKEWGVSKEVVTVMQRER